MAYSKALNPVNGTGSQTINALKEQVHTVRYGSLSHSRTNSITIDNSGQVSTTFKIPSGAATSVYMDFATGTTYDPTYGVIISITATGVDNAGVNIASLGELAGLVMTANNGAITIYRIDQGDGVTVDLAKPILEDFSGFGDVHVHVDLSYDPAGAGQVFSMTSHYN